MKLPAIQLFVVLSLLAGGSTVPAQTPAPEAKTDFRSARWGMSQKTVLSTEHSRPAAIDEADGQVIVRFDSLGTSDPRGSCFYYFINDKLVRARYVANEIHDEPQDFISDFAAVESRLQETSGKPVIDRAVWESDLYQQERLPYLEQDRAHASDILPSDKNTGLSVSLGYLKMYTERLSTRSRIVHTLTGAESRVSHQIEYRSLEVGR